MRTGNRPVLPLPHTGRPYRLIAITILWPCLYLARLEYGQAQYSEAREHYRDFLALPGNKEDKHIERANDGIARCDFSIRAVKNPVDFKPVSLGASVNTAEDEYWPSISADEQTLVITRLVKVDPVYEKKQEDFYISHWTENGWGPLKDAGYPLEFPRQ